MSEVAWLQQYVHLIREIDQIFHATSGERFLECSSGLEAWDLTPRGDPPATLLRQADQLAAAIGAQGFTPTRQLFFEKQLVALETVCRRLNGEQFPLYDEAERCFDMAVGWIDEAEFDQALLVYEETLPGTGPVADRFAQWRQRHAQGISDSAVQAQVLATMLDEIRQRTAHWLPLPAEETVEVSFFDDRSYSGEALYCGNYHSKIGLHVLLLRNLNLVLENLCHEGYPGHHVECCLKEARFVRAHHYAELGMWVRWTPQTFISEGIAQSALSMLFPGNDAETWLAQRVYPLLGLDVPPADSQAIMQARDTLEGAWCNAALLLRQGASDAEVAAYLTRYMLPPDVDFLKTPFLDTVMFSYVFSKRMMRPLLASPAARTHVTRLLTEQVVPSALTAAA